jgi:hypothetical protein
LSPSWLLFAEGSDQLGSSLPSDSVAVEVRRLLVAALRAREKGTAEEINQVLAEPNQLLEEVITRYCDRLAMWRLTRDALKGRELRHKIERVRRWEYEEFLEFVRRGRLRGLDPRVNL